MGLKTETLRGQPGSFKATTPASLILGHGFPGGSDGRVCLQCGRPGFNPWVRKIPSRRKWQATPVFLPGEFHPLKKEMASHSSLLAWRVPSPQEGNGKPLQSSCLESSMDRGAWWATVHGVTRSQTRLRD